jgi:hypothetical protein
MELLLNLIWLALGMGSLLIFLRCRPRSSLASLPYRQSLLALACALLLLFPVVSASDDLHPAQALLEDATKRVQQLTSPLQASHGGPANAILPLLPALSALFAFSVWQPWRPVEAKTHALTGYRLFPAGRAPPFFVS